MLPALRTMHPRVSRPRRDRCGVGGHGDGTDAPAHTTRVTEGGERRWPMASAVIAAIVLTVLLPNEVRAGPRWLLPGVEGLLLVALILGDPGRISRRSAGLRLFSICLVGVLAFDALWSTVRLVDELIQGGAITQSAEELLQAGAVVWISNNLAFALLYWELDGGGPAARLWHPRRFPDLAFPQELSPGIAPEGWKPQFFDYLYLAVTNATAFSPTDVMPLAGWAKSAMAVQALISLTVLGLVVARAINVLS
jgi:uncharacterized membrane protein